METGGEKLSPNGVLQVDLGTPGRLTELDCHFRTYLKTARPDSRTDGRV